jgi:hypothetical protein
MSLSPRAIAEPSACGRCGIPEREHWLQATATDVHAYEPPTTAQIKDRMQARRATTTETV